MKRVAIIGSRTAPVRDCEALEEIAVEFLTQGYHGVSGGAPGPDAALTNAIRRLMVDTGLSGRTFGTIWLPSRAFNGLTHGDLGGACRNAEREPFFRGQAAQLAMEVHGGWHNLTPFMRRLHARNSFQVLTETMHDPVDYVVCAAHTTRSGNVKGGTATAVKIAARYGVEVINVLRPGGYERVNEILTQ